MDKLENVIKGLEESYQQYSVVERQGILVDHDGYEYALIDPVLIIDALALLKSQEPMLVKYTTSTIRCPKCNKQITNRGSIHNEFKFCWK